MEEILNIGEQAQESVQTDAAQASENQGVATLTELLGASAEEDAEEKPQPSQEAGEEQQEEAEPKVSGGIKGRLLEAEKRGQKRGYDAGRQAAEQSYKAQLAEMQAKIDKLTEYELHEEAAALAKEEGCSEKLAMRILRAERGLPPVSAQDGTNSTPPASERKRDAQGRFVAHTEPSAESADAAVRDRAQFLWNQAETIKRLTGVDAMALYQQADAETQRKIARGEMDFTDLAAQGQTDTPKRTPPVVRTSGGGVQTKKLSDMTGDDFRRVDDYVKGGGVIRIE